MEADLRQQNIGLVSARRKAAIREDWRHSNAPAECAIKDRRKAVTKFEANPSIGDVKYQAVRKFCDY